MKRLNFVLPDWTRVIWASAEARDVWQPRIQRISNAFLDIEKKSVFTGHRKSNLTFLRKEDLPKEKAQIPMYYEKVSPYLKVESKSKAEMVLLEETYLGNSYSNSSHGNFLPQQKNAYRVAFTQPQYVNDWLEAWKNNDNVAIGQLLDYPPCCIDFFEKYWVKEQYIDTTYPMSLNGTEGPKECNILLRWLGVRAVSHLPCSFSCENTYKIARSNIEFGRELGYNEEMDWLEEMLSWPVEWSALHGIAEIKTPILKISTRTDATADLVVVQKQGYSYPKEGVSGNKFPYVNKAKIPITESNSFKRSILLEDLWKDNGFASFEAMKHSHDVILSLVKENRMDYKTIVDYGCGNGELLRRIEESLKLNCRYIGIEIDEERAKHGKINFPQAEYVTRNIFETNIYVEEPSLSIIMPGRFFEVDEFTALNFFKKFTENQRVLFYAYADRIPDLKSEKLVKLLNKVGFKFTMLDKREGINVVAYYGYLTKIVTNKKENLLVLQGV